VKLIDFGSAFVLSKDDTPVFSMNTPEYLAPEVLQHLEQIKQYALLPSPSPLT